MAVSKKIVEATETKEDAIFRKRQAAWEINQELISDAYFKYILKYKKYPTYSKLAKQLGLNEKTIRRHLQETDLFGDMKLKLSALKEQSLLTIGIKAIQGKSVAWSKLFHEIVDGVGAEKESQNITININGKKVGANS